MQTTRRNFLKGLLSSVAAGALIKNGILQPEQVIAEPKRRVFDMAANTWRENRPISSILKWTPRLRPAWPMELTEASLSMAQVEFTLKHGCLSRTLVVGTAAEMNALCLLRSYCRPCSPLDSVVLPHWNMIVQTSADPAAWWLT